MQVAKISHNFVHISPKVLFSRYWYWHPIDYSAAPLYCYLYRQCADKDGEPEVALVMGGRHPGHYFMSSDESNDVVTR